MHFQNLPLVAPQVPRDSPAFLARFLQSFRNRFVLVLKLHILV